MRQQRVTGALRSFAEDESLAGEKFSWDMLACYSAGEAASSTSGRPRAAVACQRPAIFTGTTAAVTA